MPKRILSNERVVVTRGSGSLGEVGVRRLLGAEPGMPIKAIMVFSCDDTTRHAVGLAYWTRKSGLLDVMYRNLELKRHKLMVGEGPAFDEDVLA
jgi:hypothetical protein